MSQLVDGWAKIGFMPQLAVCLLVLSAVPLIIWALNRPRPVGTWRQRPGLESHSLHIPAWVLMEVAAFLAALLLLWFGWLRSRASVDCVGVVCAQGMSDLRSAHASFLVFLIIPVVGVLAWLLVNRRRSHQS